MTSQDLKLLPGLPSDSRLRSGRRTVYLKYLCYARLGLKEIKTDSQVWSQSWM